MHRIKTVIVDDEFLARERIKILLSKDPEIHVVAEFNTGKEAISFINSYDVDILYLDIHMPENDGFSVIKKISEEKMPFLIFATADNKFAIKAFEFKALDYILKPFRSERFYTSLKNAKQYVELKKKATIVEKVSELFNDFSDYDNNILIEDNRTIYFDDVIYIKSDGNYLRLYNEKSNYELVRKTMIEVYSNIKKHGFIRIHRSIVINSYFIKQVKYIGNNEFEITLIGNIKLKSSRSFKKEILSYQKKNRL